ncbi:Intramembrane protease 2 [Trichuris trichiura]|uniref:Intramembrane protease 2 n=1 Tax=Trichuris trichiura TaxID=36087 RepID=A0A077YWS6_TRITR|nr:Intramembrane protease 2 [Trichuris trichiura]
MDQANGTNMNNTSTASETELLIAYASMHSMAVISILIGCFRSLAFVRRHVKEKTKIPESISSEDVLSCPIKASIVLFALYVLIKHEQVFKAVSDYTFIGKQIMLDKMIEFGVDGVLPSVSAYLNASLAAPAAHSNGESLPKVETNTSAMNNITYINVLQLIVNKKTIHLMIRWAICFVGLTCCLELFKPYLEKFITKLPSGLSFLKKNVHYKLSLSSSKSSTFNKEKSIFASTVDRFDAYGMICLLPLFVFHVIYLHWISNDILGMAISVCAIGSFHLSSFKAGVALLAGLFVYDIFWVFATDVMTTVASNLDAPVMLKFPQNVITAGILASAGRRFTMLGLGDIVLPGMFIALLLRFGAKRRTRSYFYVAVIAYAAGLIVTMFVMHIFQAGQPALLYLVPSCLGMPALWSLIRGEYSALVSFSEEHLTKTDERCDSEEEKEVDRTVKQKERKKVR